MEWITCEEAFLHLIRRLAAPHVAQVNGRSGGELGATIWELLVFMFMECLSFSSSGREVTQNSDDWKILRSLRNF